jgi:hypothetical protein
MGKSYCVPLCLPPARIHFWLLWARFSVAMSEWGSTVPRNIDLYWPGGSAPILPAEQRRELTWFIPAFANNNVGSSYGIVDDEGTKVWLFWAK